MTTKIPRREFVQLLQVYDPDKHDVVGMYASRKLDGQRCIWIPQSRGMSTVNVPWANLDKKVRPVATGLWSRYGNVIEAPAWFLDALPNEILDGELYCGPGKFQTTMSIVKRDVPDQRWSQVMYAVYGSPDLAELFRTGEIKNANFNRVIDEDVCHKFFDDHDVEWDAGFDFEQEVKNIKYVLEGNDVAYPVVQTLVTSMAHFHELHKEAVEAGCEGTVLRHPNSRWTPKRVNDAVKVKDRFDDEATVVGFVAGREGKKGLVQGKLGALVVEWKGVRFELGSGLSMAERQLDPVGVCEMACENPGKPLEISDTGQFKIGDKVTFSFREISDGGTPKEGTFVRRFQAI